MKRINLWLLLLFLLFFFDTVAQKKTTKKSPAQKPAVTKQVVQQKPDAAADEKKVRDIVAFLEYMLNTLGSSSTPIRDKEVLVTESYSKIFRDSKVQIEDDLDEERNVITNKDVVAYLKDVNFFFGNVRFEFTIEDIKGSALPNGQHFYKVSATRNLQGTTSDGKPVNNIKPRFIEINYDPDSQDLKIVSMYTNEFDEKRALTGWWQELSYEWQSVFQRKLNLVDSVSLADLKRITTIEELDISNNQYILTLEPLSQLINLKSLNLSNAKVNDLTPIRNLSELVALNVSDTRISDLSPLKYSINMEALDISSTDVTDISVLEKMPALQRLTMSGTRVNNFTPIAKLTGLQQVDLSATNLADLSVLETLNELYELNISSVAVQDLNPLKGLKNLKILDIDSTQITTINALANLENLSILSANHTALSDLAPLQKLVHLEKIYCDHSLIKREAADTFMKTNPRVLVIFDSRDLKAWWDTLSPGWQGVFIKAAKLEGTLSKEELALIPLLDSVNIGGNSSITTLEPLRKLQKLKTVIASKTSVADLSPLRDLTDIRYLDISGTSVGDLAAIKDLTSLKVLKADNSEIKNIEQLQLPGLEKFYADDTGVNDIVARGFLEKNPRCLLVYKTGKLNTWWNILPETWKGIFNDQIGKNNDATREQLHGLVEQEALHFKDVQVSDLAVLSEFVRLNELHFSGTAMTTIVPLDNLRSLKSLHATNSPVQDIVSLESLAQLEDLDISNTPVTDVSILWKLKTLKKLNFAGTQIKRLDAMEVLENLEYLDFSNTNVGKISPLDYLPLKTLKCYNTKVSGKAVEKFKASHPECDVVYY